MSLTSRARDALTAARAAWSGTPSQARRSSISAPAPYQDRYYRVLGSGLTPQAVTAALRAADRGHMQVFCDLLTESRSKVSHLQSVLGTREKAIASCPVVIDPAETTKKGDAARAEKYADYIRGRFKEIPELKDRIEHLSGGIYFGRSACEVVWKRDTEGLGIARLETIHPRRLSYTENWDLHLWDASGNSENSDLSLWPGLSLKDMPEKWVVCSPRTAGAEYPNRQGLGYCLVWCALWWTWTARDWMQFAELFGKPWRVATIEEGGDESATDAVRDILVDLVSSGVGVFPPGIKPELWASPAKGDGPHGTLREVWDSEISKVVLGQTGTTELGDKASYAATKVHDLVRGDIKQADGVSLGTSLQTLANTLLRFKFGEGALRLAPVVRVVTESVESVDPEFKRVTELSDRGVAFDADEARKRYTPMNKPKDGATLIGQKNKPQTDPVEQEEPDEPSDQETEE